MKSKINRYITFFIVALNLATILNIYVVSDFVKNKDQIINSLCVQKEFKINTCQGKCHLKNQLISTEKSTQENKSIVATIPQFNFINSILIFQNLPIVDAYVLNRKNSFITSLSVDYSYLFFHFIFHPPILVS